MANLLILHAGRTLGPYTADETRSYLASGHLAPETPAWTEGLTDWSTISQVLEILGRRPVSNITPVFTDVAERVLLPDGVRGFCWGAMLAAPLWSIGNRVWLGLLTFIPGLGQLMMLWLGFNGRELAWRKGGWKSVNDFQRVQRRWSQVAITVWIVAIVLIFVLLAQRGYFNRTTVQPQPAAANPAPEPAAGKPVPQPGRKQTLTLPASHQDFERLFKERTIEEVRSALGKPVDERADKAKGVVVYAYRNLTLQPGSQKRDDIVLILFLQGRVKGFQYKQENPQ